MTPILGGLSCRMLTVRQGRVVVSSWESSVVDVRQRKPRSARSRARRSSRILPLHSALLIGPCELSRLIAGEPRSNIHDRCHCRDSLITQRPPLLSSDSGGRVQREPTHRGFFSLPAKGIGTRHAKCQRPQTIPARSVDRRSRLHGGHIDAASEHRPSRGIICLPIPISNGTITTTAKVWQI
jgi:hypothetical protein